MSPDFSAKPDRPEVETDDVQLVWLEQHANDAGQLAAMVSLAALVDPGLLRAARLALKLAVSAEVELRCSPMVSSAGASGLILADEVLPELRRRLVQSEMLLAAWELTRARHRAISPALAMEETLTYQALSGEADAGRLAESELNRALVAFVRDEKTQIAAWAARALPRLPEAVREVPSARYLASAAEVHGYRNASTIKTSGAPPGWMVRSKSSPILTGGVSLFGSRLEIAFPWRTGDLSLLLPEDRRVWVSWVTGTEHNTEAVTVPNGSAVSLEIDGPEITIEAPGMGKLVLQPAEQKRAAIFLEIPKEIPSSRLETELLEFISSRLENSSFSVTTGDALQALRAQAEYFIFFAPDDSLPLTPLDELLKQCRPVILLHTIGVLDPDLISPIMMSTPDPRALLNITCVERADWDGAVRDILAAIAQPAKGAGSLRDVPPATAPFYRRTALFEQLTDGLLGSSAGIVNLFGTPGMGRTSAAIDFVNDCSVRRRFTGGIFWSSRGHARISYAEHPYLLVLEDPNTETAEEFYTIGATMAALGDAILLLTQRPAPISSQRPSINADLWSSTERYELFELGMAGSVLSGVPQETILLAAGNTVQATVNLGRLAGMAIRAKQDVGNTIKDLADTGSELAVNRRMAIHELDLLTPLAACPPAWPLAHASWSGWNRYFTEDRRNQVPQALEYFERAFPQRTLPQEVATALAELALPTHQRIVDSCEAECGGDWALLPDDDYLLPYFLYHLSNARPESISELTENLDWLLQHGIPPAGAPSAAQSPRPSPADRLRLLRSYMDHQPQKVMHRMARARVSLAVNGPTRWIQVIGLGQYTLAAHLLEVSRRIGRELARWGYGLLNGGFPGVDYVTAETFCDQLRLAETDPSRALLQIVNLQGTAQFKLGAVQHVAEADRRAVMLAKADAIVAIGGDGYTLEHCRVAAAAGKPVFPIPGSGGDAANFYATLPVDQARRLEPLNLHLASPRNQFEVARKLMELLPPPISWTASPDKGGDAPVTHSPARRRK